MQMLQLGNVQIIAPSVSKFWPLGIREFEVFDLPCIIDDEKDLLRSRHALGHAPWPPCADRRCAQGRTSLNKVLPFMNWPERLEIGIRADVQPEAALMFRKINFGCPLAPAE